MVIELKKKGDVELKPASTGFQKRQPTEARALQEFGGAISGASDLAARHALQIKENDDITTTENIDNAFQSELMRVHGEYRALKGESAYKGLATYMKDVDKLKRDHVEQGENSRQKELLGRVIDPRINNNMRQATDHSIAQRDIWQGQVAESTIASALNNALATGDSKERAQEQNRAFSSIDDMSRLQGWDAEVTKGAKEKWTSNLHKFTIDQMVINDPTAAKAYYEKFGDKIIGAETRIAIEKDLKTANVRAEGQRNADAILLKGGTDTEMREEAKAIEDDAVRDDTVSRVDKSIARRKSDRIEHERAFNQDRWKELEAAQKANAPISELEAIKDRIENDKVRKEMDKWIKAKTTGTDVATNRKAYYDLRKMASSTNIKESDKFKELDLNEYKGSLSFPDFKAMVELQIALKTSSPKTTQIITPITMAENTWRTLGLGKTSDNIEAFSSFEKEFADRTLQYELTELGGKRKASRIELQSIINDIAMQGIMVDIDRWGWFTGNKTRPLGEVEPGTEVEGVEFEATRARTTPAPPVAPSVNKPAWWPEPAEKKPEPKIEAREGIKPPAPAVGTIQDGYRFNGGDPANQANWERVQ